MNEAEKGMATYLGEDRLRFLQSLTIGIAGAGGLGSNCAMMLVRSGFKRFVLCDFDRLEASNLNRQCYRLDQLGQLKVRALADQLRAVNPDLHLDLRTVRITPENMESLFMDCDVVVEAFDQPEVKKLLVETFLPTDKLIVAASGMGGTGRTDAMITRKVRDNFYLVGDMETECSMDLPPFAPRIAIAAAKQADVVLDHCLERYAREKGDQ